MGFSEDMAKLQNQFKLLEREYEQFFSGALQKPPVDNQKSIEAIVRRYSQSPPRNLTEQSVFSMFQAKFNTYCEMWNRRMRLKEEGKLPTGREERSKRVAAQAASAAAEKTGSDPFRAVFETYVAAKKKSGESIGQLNYDSFRKTLEKQAAQLRESRGFKDVNFGVAVKDGKVSLVAKPKK